MIFEIDNVELYFKHKRILNGIYLKAETGKIIGILGSNGCGKSCLLDIIFGNLQPKYKLLRIDSKPILAPLYTMGIVKYLPQYHFVPNNLKLYTIFNRFDVSWELFLTRFKQFTHQKKIRFKALSDGEKRLIEIYIILMSESTLVLLDEPFNGIAPIYIEQIKALLKQEKQHKAILLTDHRYDVVLDITDYVYLIKNGCTTLIKDDSDLEDYNYIYPGHLS